MTVQRVLANVQISMSCRLLWVDRPAWNFFPGQHVTLGIPGETAMREYSIYSGIHENRLGFLIRIVEGGTLTSKLEKLTKNDFVTVSSPLGSFLENLEQAGTVPWLIATGTGIAPFHSFHKSFPERSLHLLHGIRTIADLPLSQDLALQTLTVCVSQDPWAGFKGRVTDYIRLQALPDYAQVFLCGRCEMIYDVFDLLKIQGLSSQQVRTEIYY